MGELGKRQELLANEVVGSIANDGNSTLQSMHIDHSFQDKEEKEDERDESRKGKGGRGGSFRRKPRAGTKVGSTNNAPVERKRHLSTENMEGVEGKKLKVSKNTNDAGL
ncbi:hypothetical protein PVAP13_8NG212701 [Panicum virgatum]|uniref:Uncharacterized protein n=1 Tax=Panicum virgatum TaxID=38727 RepID=A0A8T0P5I2_PANVG|nr:hypothetical protein PVAP13_8NG212701 [Panicum virgatum]